MSIPRSPCGLLDGGANGGIVFNTDMDIMDFHPDNRHVNIIGVVAVWSTINDLLLFVPFPDPNLDPSFLCFTNMHMSHRNHN